MNGLRVGYYVHHHGRGHATRAGVIGHALRQRGHEVTYLGSGVLPEGTQIVLPRDDDGEQFVDSDAGGILHWAPLGGGYAQRAQQIAAWVQRERPDVMVVDVSVEVTLLVRLLGVPVVVVAQPGVRDDVAHGLAYDAARGILAPWPQGLDVAPHLQAWRDKVVYTGGLTRFMGVRAHPRIRFGALLVGGEGWDDPQLPSHIRRAIPEITWMSPGPDVAVADLLDHAEVVVSHAGQNAIADVAAFRVPAVILAQNRPFNEQADMARGLHAAGFAQGLEPGAELRAITAAIQAARGNGERWEQWGTDGAADRACHMIEEASSWQK